MTLVIGSARQPDRPHARRLGTYDTHLDFPAPTHFARIVEPEEMVDIRGRRSEIAQVVDNIGQPSLLCRVWNWTIGRDFLIAFNASGWTAATTYELDQVVVVSGVYWVCTLAGRSSAFGLGPSGASPAVEGTVVWESFVPDEQHAAVDMCRVLVWDVDAGALVDDRYPEYALLPLTSYREWLETGEPLDPTNVLPDVHVRSIDADALPADVADVARSVKLGA